MNPPTHPRVTVVLPTFRRPRLLPRALDSVKRQTLQEWELVVVDDNDVGSDERAETRTVMNALQEDDRVKYSAHESNRGGGAARNTGIALATAPLVAFLDDDDEWYPDKLSKQVEFLERAAPAVALVYCRFRRISPDGAVTAVSAPDARNHSQERLLLRNGIGTTSSIVCRTDALRSVGGFDEELASKQDIDLYIRLAERYEFGFVDEVLLDYHRHAGEAIGTNLDRTLDAHDHFERKHAALIARHPEVARYRLLARATLLRRAGQFGRSRELFLRAWRDRPYDPRPLLEMLKATSTATTARRFVRERPSGRFGDESG